MFKTLICILHQTSAVFAQYIFFTLMVAAAIYFDHLRNNLFLSRYAFHIYAFSYYR